MHLTILTLVLIAAAALSSCKPTVVNNYYYPATPAAEPEESPEDRKAREEAAEAKRIEFDRRVERELAQERKADRAAFEQRFGFPAKDAHLYPRILFAGTSVEIRRGTLRTEFPAHFSPGGPFEYATKNLGVPRVGVVGEEVTSWKWRTSPVRLSDLPKGFEPFAQNENEAINLHRQWQPPAQP
jgi:hypothetical protein